MKEPSPRASRLAMTAGILAVAVVGGGGFLLGQRTATPPPAPPATPTGLEVAPSPTPTSAGDATRVLGRADLMALSAAATDATARGAALPAALRDAVGRDFAITLPFGCDGPAAVDGEAAMRWRYDEASGALRVHVAPVAWPVAAWWPRGAPAGVEAVEGFWIPRPWTGSEACPAARDPVAATGMEPVTLPGQTLAIGRILDAEGGRRDRREGKPYTAVLRMTADAVRGDRGFRLRLTGRIVAGPGGSPVICQQAGGAEQRPVCLIATSPGDVAIENIATGETLATWPASEPRTADRVPVAGA